jgi:hypothetical protein
VTGFLRQFGLAWALADLHLAALVDDDHLWEPAPVVWTLQPDGAGRWRPDWAEVEPDPVPVPTIGWLLWQMMCWRTAAAASLDGNAPPEPATIECAAAPTPFGRKRGSAGQWRSAPAGLDPHYLKVAAMFPWGPHADRTV